MKSPCPPKLARGTWIRPQTLWLPTSPRPLIGTPQPYPIQENCSSLCSPREVDNHTAPPSVELKDPGADMEPKPGQSPPRVNTQELGKRGTPFPWRQDRTLLKSHSRHQAGGASHRRTRRAETEGGVGSSVPTGPCAPAVPRPGSVLQPINPPPPIRLDSLLLAIQPILNNQRKWSRSVMSDSLQPHGL